MTRRGDILFAPCGFEYKSGDFRVGINFRKDWESGQSFYENFHERNLIKNEGKLDIYKKIDNETNDVYNKIILQGDVLDVGGGWGALIKQANLDPIRYISVDPLPAQWRQLKRFKQFTDHYSICANAARLVGYAEFLPLADGTFDVVHMRSCLDHFSNPILSLQEAYRVLRENGKLVIGLSLEGAYKKVDLSNFEKFKNFIKRLPLADSIREWVIPDHHMFHPTYENLIKMIELTSFKITQEVWQSSYHNVIYFEATKVVPQDN